MTLNEIGGASAYYSTSANQAVPSEGQGKVEGHRPPPPPPPPKNQDTYEASQEGLDSLSSDLEDVDATLAELMEEYIDKEAEEETDTGSDKTTSGMDAETVLALKADLAQQQQNFVNSMVSMITGQASTSLDALGIWDSLRTGTLEVTPEVQAEAQESISEDGYWGVEQTANRIVDMAKALVGSDPDKAEEMMAAIEKGFAAAEDTWGGELPSITADTKARIDELFAEWTA